MNGKVYLIPTFNLKANDVNFSDIKSNKKERLVMTRKSAAPGIKKVQRVQTGVRLEKRLLKVLKGLAEYYDMTLGDLLEGIVLSSFEGESPFSEKSLERIKDLKKIYELDLTSEDSHKLTAS
jgi:hypothetical protein